MPKKTFLNLPKPKQQQFLKVAFEEFALHEYHQASITRIVNKLGIAKGSIYQYFENKRDLYFYLLEVAGRMRAKAGEANGNQTPNDFFQFLAENFIKKIHFDLEHPSISGFLFNVMQEKNSDELGNIQLKTKMQTMEFVRQLMERFKSSARIRKDADEEMISYYIVQMQWGFYDYLELKYSFNFREKIKENSPIFDISDDEIEQVVMRFIQLLREGIKRN